MTSSEKTLIPKRTRIGVAGRGARRPWIGQDVMALMADSRAGDGLHGISPRYVQVIRSREVSRGVQDSRIPPGQSRPIPNRALQIGTICCVFAPESWCRLGIKV